MSFAPQAILTSPLPLAMIPDPLRKVAAVLSSSHLDASAVCAAELLDELLGKIYRGDVASMLDLPVALALCATWQQGVAANACLHPIAPFQEFIKLGDCTSDTAEAFLLGLLGRQRFPQERDCYGNLGQLLRTASNYDETVGQRDWLKVPESGEPVLFSQRGFNTVLIAIWCAAGARSLTDAFARLVYVGGDADTVGAVMGQLMCPLLPASEVCEAFERFVAVGRVDWQGAPQMQVSNAAARRFFYRALLFCSSQWAKVVERPRLIDPAYPRLTDPKDWRILLEQGPGGQEAPGDDRSSEGQYHKRRRVPKGQWLHLAQDAATDAALFMVSAVDEARTLRDVLSGRCPALVQSLQTEMYLNLDGGQDGEGIHVQMWDNPQNSHSQWLLEPVEANATEGACRIMSVHTGFCLGAGRTSVRTTSLFNSLATHWHFILLSEAAVQSAARGGLHVIRSASSGQYLTLAP